jgi:hypothetical protein
MNPLKVSTANFEQLFEVAEENLLESGYIAKIVNKDKILCKLSGLLYDLIEEKLPEKINLCFNIYSDHRLFTTFFSYDCKTNSWNCSFNDYLREYSLGEDSFIEIAVRVSSDNITDVDSNTYKIKNIFRRHYVSFYETPYFYYVNSLSKSVNTAFRLDVELKKIII